MNIRTLSVISLVSLLSACGGGGGGSSSSPAQAPTPTPTPDPTPTTLTFTSEYRNACDEKIPNPNSQLILHDENGNVAQLIDADANGLMTFETEEATLTYTFVAERLSAIDSGTLQLRSYQDFPAQDNGVVTFNETIGNCDCDAAPFTVKVVADQPIGTWGEINSYFYGGSSMNQIDQYSWEVEHQQCRNEQEPIFVSVNAVLEGSDGFIFGSTTALPDAEGKITVNLVTEATTQRDVISPSEVFVVYDDFEAEYTARASSNDYMYITTDLNEGDHFYHYCLADRKDTPTGVSLYPRVTGFSRLLDSTLCTTDPTLANDVYISSVDESSISYEVDAELNADVMTAYSNYELSGASGISRIQWDVLGPASNNAIPLFELTPELNALSEEIEYINLSLYLEDFEGITDFQVLAKEVLLDFDYMYGESMKNIGAGDRRFSLYVQDLFDGHISEL